MAFSFYLMDMLNRHFFTGETLSSPITPPHGTGAYLGLATDYPDDEDDGWYEVSGNAYARVGFTFLWNASNLILYPSGNVTFPRATPSGWGTVIGAIIYNNSSGEYPLFDLPWWQTASGPKVASYTVAAEQRPYFVNDGVNYFDIKLSLHGKEPVSTSNGGISVQYATVISQWIANLAPVPYARTYNVAIGRDLQIDAHGRFAGVWQECAGYGYQRVAMAASDWFNYPTAARNVNEIVFPLATGTWGPMTHVVLYPSNAPEIPAFWGCLETPVNIITGDAFSIGPTSLTISWEGEVI
jgi:hypothetical protein